MTPSSDHAGDREVLVARALLALENRGSAPGVVLLTGPAGSGKTWLARQVRTRSVGLGLYVVGSPAADPQAPALWPWRRVLHAVSRSRGTATRWAVTRALTQLSGPSPTELHTLSELVVDALQDAAQDAPYVIFVEDVHRFDPPSLAVLDLLSDPLSGAGPPILACCTVGPGIPEQVGHTLRALVGKDRVQVLELPPLTDAAVAAVVAQHAPDLPDARRDLVIRLSRGNPGLAVAFAVAERQPGQHDLCAGPSASAARVLADRVSATDGFGVLSVLAVVNRPATLSLLAAASGTSVAVTQQVVDQAVAEGLVESTGTLGLVQFVHPVVTSTVRAGLDPGRTRAVHHRIAALLGGEASDGPEAVERARHLLAAGDESAAAARACLAASLVEERLYDLDAAEQFARYGLEIQSAEPATRVELLRVKARIADRTGDRLEARRLAEAAVTLALGAPGRPGLAAAVADLTTVDHGIIDVSPERRSLIEQALALPDSSDAIRAVLLARLSEAVFLSDLEASRRLAAEAIALSEATRSESAVQAARVAWLMLEHRLATVGLVESEARRLHGLGIRSPGLGMEVGPALSRGDRGVVDAVLDHAERRAQTSPSALGRGVIGLVRLGLAVCDGDGDAVKQYASGVASHATPDFQAVALPALLFWAGHSGHLLEVIGSFATTAPTATDLGRIIGLAVETMAVINDPTRSTDGVAALVEPRGVLLDPREDVMRDVIMVLAAMVGYVLRDGELCQAALAHFAGHEDRFVTMGSLVVVAPAGWATTFAHLGAGDVAAALDANERATAASRRARFTTWAAQCLCQRAEILAPRDLAASAQAARDGLTLAGQRNLDLLAAKLGRLAAAVPAPGQSPLSPAQEQVLALTAGGLTNDQIARRLGVAVSTVEKHLTQVYRRLEVPNRAAAVRWYTTTRRGQSEA